MNHQTIPATYTDSDIYSIPFLRSKAEEVIARSIQELETDITARNEFAVSALFALEGAGIYDALTDYLYNLTKEEI